MKNNEIRKKKKKIIKLKLFVILLNFYWLKKKED